MQKFDPYINIDPGTMNPVQHGEVFVTDDGAETDLDLGHYERFIDESLTKNSRAVSTVIRLQQILRLLSLRSVELLVILKASLSLNPSVSFNMSAEQKMLF